VLPVDVATGTPASSAVTSAAVQHYLALGDSYTIGEAVAPRECWPAQLARALQRCGVASGEPQIIARTGWTTSELNQALDAAAPTAHRQLVTLQIGVNNQYRGESLDAYRSEFSALLARAVVLADGCARRVVVVSIPDWGVTPFAHQQQRDVLRVAQEIDAFNASAQAVAAHAGAHWCDVTTISRQYPALLADDGLHPSGAQYRRWTDAIAPVARRAWSAPDA
jgi:lysophospholipase L1-like esterase